MSKERERVSVGWLVRQSRSERALKCAPQMSSPSLGAGGMKKTTANAVVAARRSRGWWVDRHDSTELSQAHFRPVFKLQDKARSLIDSSQSISTNNPNAAQLHA